ncbi:MAG: ATP-binding protein, partial [Pseudomonadota bacterium]
LFHAILGSILLPKAEVWIQGLTAICLFIAFIALEYLGVIPHYHLEGFSPECLHLDLLYISVISCVLMVTLFSTIHMSSSIVQSLRVREEQLFSTQDMLRLKTRELEIANQQLREKQKQLVLSEKLMSLGQLAAGVAHEINNPVQFIQGNLTIIKEALDGIIPILDGHAMKNPEMRLARLEYGFFRDHIRVLVNDMTTGTEHIRDIVRDLKAFARSDEGRRDQEVDVNEVVRVCQRLVHNKTKHFRVEEDLEPDLPCLRGNINEIEQVVMANLINAADALSGRSGGTIRIITRTEDGGKEISLSICDNGTGMTDAVMKRIFDPFFTTKQRSGGTGLGLSVTYGIVKEHGGQIDVKSNVGEGTAFTYRWPVQRSG